MNYEVSLLFNHKHYQNLNKVYSANLIKNIEKSIAKGRNPIAMLLCFGYLTIF